MTRLVLYNIEYCEGLIGRWFDYLKFWKIFFPPKGLDRRIMDSLEALKPDILSLIEVDTGSFRSKKDQVHYFESHLEMNDVVSAIKYSFQGWTKLFHFVPILNKQANAIMARYKMSDVKYHLLHEGSKRVVIEATMHLPKKVTHLVAHLSLGKKARAKQIDELIGIINGIKNPIILMGDFNTRREGEIQKLLASTNLQDKHMMNRFGRSFTFPTSHPKRRIDYVLTSPEIKVRNYEVLPFQFSDHLPLMLDFDI